MNLAELERDIRVQGRKYKNGGSIHQILKENCKELNRLLVVTTPVDTGRARGNWQVNLGVPSGAPLNLPVSRSNKNPLGMTQKAISEGNATIDRSTLNGKIYLENNLDYVPLHLNQGSSMQAPAGYIDVIVRSAFSKLKSDMDRG